MSYLSRFRRKLGEPKPPPAMVRAARISLYPGVEPVIELFKDIPAELKAAIDSAPPTPREPL